MSPTRLIDDPGKTSARAPMPRTWAGTVVKQAERATHYLHLAAVPCERCKGPVISGWIGRRADDITRETPVHTVGAICMSCGLRPESVQSAATPTQIRPFIWEWVAEAVLPAKENEGDSLSRELSQDADTDANSSTLEKATSR